METKLSNIQLELLKLYAFDVSDEEIVELKKVLSIFFANRIKEKASIIYDEKGYSEKDLENWLNQDDQ